MKKQLLEGISRYDLEHYRKTPEQVREHMVSWWVDAKAFIQLDEIQNKKVRAFYEEQNRRLDDWLEVDTIVRYISDDVIESFDPVDEDGDGVPEQRGGLQLTQEDVEPLLPLSEQENRRRARRSAKWAINVSRGPRILSSSPLFLTPAAMC